MGCFNVSCGISKMSIGLDDEVYVIPLYKSAYAQNLSRKMMILSQEEIFAPLCFPIKGTYDEYGSIENIEKNKNTKIIENYFKLKIEDFINIICDSRGNDLYDSYCKIHEILFNKKDLKYLKKDVSLNDFFKHFGFKENNKTYERDNIIFDISEGETNKYVKLIYNNEETKIFCDYGLNDSSFKYSILSIFSEKTNNYLGVKKGYENIVKILLNTYIMFVKAEIYEYMCEKTLGNKKRKMLYDCNISESILKKLNFKEKELGSGEYIYDEIKDLSIKLSYPKNIIKIENKTYKVETILDLVNFIEKEYNKKLNLKNIEEIEFKVECLLDLVKNKGKYNDFCLSNLIKRDISMIIFEEWKYFYEIYLDKYENILEIKKEICDYNYFHENMFLTNNMFFPSFAGPQNGDIKAEKDLNKKITELIEKRLE